MHMSPAFWTIFGLIMIFKFDLFTSQTNDNDNDKLIVAKCIKTVNLMRFLLSSL